MKITVAQAGVLMADAEIMARSQWLTDDWTGASYSPSVTA